MECLWLEIFLPSSKGILFGTFYRPPTGSRDFTDYFLENTERASFENNELILTGDFNYHLLLKSDDCKRFKNAFTNIGLSQLVKEPTRITQTTATLLDLFLCSHPHNASAATIPSPLSDHNVIILIRKINGLRQKPRLINCRNYANYNPTSFQDDLMDAPWYEVLSFTSRYQCWRGRTTHVSVTSTPLP